MFLFFRPDGRSFPTLHWCGGAHKQKLRGPKREVHVRGITIECIRCIRHIACTSCVKTTRPDSVHSVLWRFINHLLTYLLTYKYIKEKVAQPVR